MITTSQKLVSFYVHDRIYGIDMHYVQEFIENIECTDLPCEINYITSVANLRGRIITVADMGLIFGRQPCQSKRLLMVMRNNFIRHSKTIKATIAFLVDNNGPIVEINEDELTTVPDFSEHDNSHLCSHMFKVNDQMLSVINPAKLFGALLSEDQ